MSSCDGSKNPNIVPFVPFFFLLVVAFSSVSASAATGGGNGSTTALLPSGQELLGFKRIQARLARVREASVKTIQARTHTRSLIPAL